MIFLSQDLRELVVADTLRYLGEWSPAAENLLLGTAIQESGMGFAMKSGRRLGLYHISPAAHRSVWDHYLIFHPEQASVVRGLAGQHSFVENPHRELVTNLRYATAIAWYIYKKSGCTLPDPGDIQGLARIWQRHFHSQPTGRVADFVRNYLELADNIRHQVA